MYPMHSPAMVQSYFEHYVIAGGWAMVLLVPASVVVLATIIRALFALRGSRFSSATAPRDVSTHTAAVAERLRARSRQFGKLAADDISTEIDLEIVELYSIVQPLPAITVLAPIVGMLASVLRIMAAQRQLAGSHSVESMALAVEGSLVPLVWGLSVAGVSYLSYAIFRARLYFCESRLLRPMVEESVRSEIKPSISLRPHAAEAEEDQ